MGKRFNNEDVKKLLQNKNVLKCSFETITYSKEFKLKAVKEYEKGKMAIQIFKEAGFDLDLIGKDTPKERMRNWKKVYREKGEQGLLEETRGRCGGRPKKIIEENDEEFLKAKIAYLEAENSFLKKLRQQKE